MSRKPEGDAARVVKPADTPSFAVRDRKMHGTTGEWKLAAGSGALIKQSGERVRLDDKPGDRNRHP